MTARFSMTRGFGPRPTKAKSTKKNVRSTQSSGSDPGARACAFPRFPRFPSPREASQDWLPFPASILRAFAEGKKVLTPSRPRTGRCGKKRCSEVFRAQKHSENRSRGGPARICPVRCRSSSVARGAWGSCLDPRSRDPVTLPTAPPDPRPEPVGRPRLRRPRLERRR